MEQQSAPDGLSLLSRLDRYWIRRPVAKPVITSNESLLLISPEHWIKYVFPCFLYIVLMGGAALILYGAIVSAPSSFAVSAMLFLVGLVILFVTQHWFFWFLLAESQAHIIVTNKRVISIRESLLWREEMVEVSFEKMKTVESYKQNFLQYVLNYGALQFESATAIRHVPHPGTMAKQIEQAMGMI